MRTVFSFMCTVFFLLFAALFLTEGLALESQAQAARAFFDEVTMALENSHGSPQTAEDAVARAAEAGYTLTVESLDTLGDSRLCSIRLEYTLRFAPAGAGIGVKRSIFGYAR